MSGGVSLFPLIFDMYMIFGARSEAKRVQGSTFKPRVCDLACIHICACPVEILQETMSRSNTGSAKVCPVPFFSNIGVANNVREVPAVDGQVKS